MKKPRHIVTDHALVRYLERAQGMDLEAVRRDLGHRIDRATDGHEGMSAVLIDGMRFLIGEGDKVVTVWEQNTPIRGQGWRKPDGRDG